MKAVEFCSLLRLYIEKMPYTRLSTALYTRIGHRVQSSFNLMLTTNTNTLKHAGAVKLTSHSQPPKHPPAPPCSPLILSGTSKYFQDEGCFYTTWRIILPSSVRIHLYQPRAVNRRNGELPPPPYQLNNQPRDWINKETRQSVACVGLRGCI